MGDLVAETASVWQHIGLKKRALLLVLGAVLIARYGPEVIRLGRAGA